MDLEEKQKPIGIFDSGIGGLTVAKAIINLLPQEDIVYLGDTARIPYGSKSKEVIITYSLKNTQFLVQKGIKLLVIACNTASATAINAITSQFAIPVIGVIEPGAYFAIEQSQSKRIGVIGTVATIESGAYENFIIRANREAIVYTKACPLFVPLAEEGWIEDEVTRLVAQRYLENFKEVDIDTLILGCTHYPVLQKVISEVMTDICHRQIKIIDSANAVARYARHILAQMNLLNDQLAAHHKHIFYVTDFVKRFQNILELFWGQDNPPESISKVDI